MNDKLGSDFDYDNHSFLPIASSKNEVEPVRSTVLESGIPSIIVRSGDRAVRRFIEFFAVTIRNPNTRAAYAQGIKQFFDWCEQRRLSIESITPLAVSAYIEQLTQSRSAPTVKQHLAAIRMCFDWLVTGHVLESNPAWSVRGPRYVVKKGKTPVLTSLEARQLIDSIDTSTLIGLRDRALIATMVYTFARVSAVIGMNVEDYYMVGKRSYIRLHEKGGKHHEVPAHHRLVECLDAYLQPMQTIDLKKTPLFQTLSHSSLKSASTVNRTGRRMTRMDALRMIKRRSLNAGLDPARICCHSFRATGITAYLENGGKLEHAQAIAAHESPRTTKLYDRTADVITLDEIERIAI